ncbi:hypothetical protein LJ753_16740 [Arthrobacter sp. zg-Y20]|uniref:hypothetical protein n=1 Tax=unclassified Arthrobacter TaxID=235627 RepID=UPI001D140ED9|nr:MULTISPECIES: hypothetical protein [unclassified Arthrobacter]MCC3277513.1 hypothetical protein [Arthrobacter sp. zg-Y20]MDK1317673.1 hypothetical protein [Arthrobacter sp. zg.Y20]WIB07068.1 hypothetical protein QNO06_04890 [Arthrobacter sp. zg-Y20]
MGLLKAVEAEAPTPDLTGRCDVTPDGGEFIDVQVTEPLKDWSAIFERFNLDPGTFVIVDDTVRMSTWQQSKRTDTGDRDVVNLYSYRARFTRKAVGAIEIKDLIADVRKWKPAKKKPAPEGTPVTMFVGWADWQLGKSEGDGTAGTTERVLKSFEDTATRIKALLKQGHNIERVLIANMGDHTEAVTGHYTSQTYSVDLNQRDQLNLAIELNMQGIKTLAPLVEHTTYAACLCNHGQWQRMAGKPITDDSDNSTGFIADTLRTVCNLHPDLAHMDWLIPRDEMITTGTFSGVNVAMGHGHKIGGNEETWLTRQSSWLKTTAGFDPELWATAHRHTASLTDYGPYHRIQCTTNDPGSKSFTDGTGKFSTRGTTTFLIGQHDARKFSHYEVI